MVLPKHARPEVSLNSSLNLHKVYLAQGEII